MKKQEKTWKPLIISLVVIFFSALIISQVFPEQAAQGNVAVIPLHGTITTTSARLSSGGSDASSIVSFIEAAEKDNKVQVIVLEINSPGGSAVGSEEIMRAVKRAEKPVIAWVRDGAASGAYWAASGADHIIANPMSIVGSIGVISEFVQIPGLLERFNVSQTTLKSGEYKDVGSPFKEMLPSEEALLQEILDEIHEEFLSSVVENRNLTELQAKEIRSAKIYLARKGLELGLVDQLGGKPEVSEFIEGLIGEEPQYAYYQKRVTIMDYLTSIKSGIMPGISSELPSIKT